jgi:hypothetical protein
MREFSFLPLPLNQGVYLFPSAHQLSEILESLPDDESVENFLNWNDAQIEQMGLLFLDPCYMPILIPLRNLCVEIGYEFTQLLLDFLTHSYYVNLFGAGLWINQKELRQVSTDVIDLLRTGTHVEVEASFPHGLSKHQDKIHQSLKSRFVTYRLACDRLTNFVELASFHGREQVNNLLADFIESTLKLHAKLPSRVGRSIPLQCPYCQQFFNRSIKPGATKPPRLHCEAAPCKKEYRRLSKRQQRAVDDGWQSTGKAANCPSCGEKRVLHATEGVCRECRRLEPSPRARNGERQNRLGDSRQSP